VIEFSTFLPLFQNFPVCTGEAAFSLSPPLFAKSRVIKYPPFLRRDRSMKSVTSLFFSSHFSGVSPPFTKVSGLPSFPSPTDTREGEPLTTSCFLCCLLREIFLFPLFFFPQSPVDDVIGDWQLFFFSLLPSTHYPALKVTLFLLRSRIRHPKPPLPFSFP